MIPWENYNRKKKKGKFLIKFLSEEFLFKFLNSGEIWFSRADKFGDKMECVLIDDLQKKSFPFDKVLERKQKHLISCWHNVGRESISMWDASYESVEKRRVYALKFEYDKLIKYVSGNKFNVDILEKNYGSVVYKNLVRDKESESLSNNKIRRAAFRKEYSFSYEQEFRFVVKTNETLNSDGIGLNIGEPNTLDFEIMINPLLKKDEFIRMRNNLKEDNLAWSKYQDSKLVKYLKPTEW